MGKSRTDVSRGVPLCLDSTCPTGVSALYVQDIWYSKVPMSWNIPPSRSFHTSFEVLDEQDRDSSRIRHLRKAIIRFEHKTMIHAYSVLAIRGTRHKTYKFPRGIHVVHGRRYVFPTFRSCSINHAYRVPTFHSHGMKHSGT